MSWWRRLRRRDRLEGELDRELRDHVERQVAEHVRAGMSEREARRRARLDFGGLDQIKELCRDARGTRWIDDLGRDLRYALQRQFTGRRSGVSVFAVAALALLIRTPSIDTLLRRSAAGAGGSTRAARVGGALVTLEVMGTVALLVTACALAVSFANLRGANVGFDRDGVLTASVNPSRVRYPDAAARRRFFRDVMARLAANAEVEAAGAALLRPLEGVIGWDLPYALPGQSPEDAAGNSILNLEVVTPAYFDAIGTPLLAGRAFAETDGPRVASAEPDAAARSRASYDSERTAPASRARPCSSPVSSRPLV